MTKRTAGVVVIAGLLAALAAGSTAMAFAATGSVTQGSGSTTMPPPPPASAPATGTPGAGPGGPGGHGHGSGSTFGVGLVEVVAKLTGETTSTVSTSRQAGTSFSAIASAKSVTASQIVELASAAPKAALASEVSNGLVTRAQADAELAELVKRLTEEIDATGATGPGGPHDGRGPGSPPPAGAVGSSNASPTAFPSGTPAPQ
jgi:hypothetical protein